MIRVIGSWYQFGPGNSVVFGSYSVKDCRYVAAHLNNGRPLEEVKKELEAIKKEESLKYSA